MGKRQIETEEDFNSVLNEISALLGYRFETDGYDTYIISAGERKKMREYRRYYFIEDAGKEICFNQIFTPMSFSTSALIDIYVKDGEDRYYYRMQQELRPAASNSTPELPDITFYEYVNGKSHVFYANQDYFETIESDTLINDISNHIIRFEGVTSPIYTEGMDKNFTGVQLGKYSEHNNKYYPLCKLDTIRGKEGKFNYLNTIAGTLAYSKGIRRYSYNQEFLFDLLPCVEKVSSETIESFEDYIPEIQVIQPRFYDGFISIVQDEDTIKCLNDSLDYFQTSKAWPFIEKYFSKYLEFIKALQSDTIFSEQQFLGEFFGETKAPEEKTIKTKYSF